MAFTYRDLCTIGSALILIGTSFTMGVFFANQTYDYHLLFNPDVTEAHFENALRHYQTLFYTHPKVLYAFGFVVSLGLIGSLIRVYKPNPDIQLFEYGSLGMYVLGVCVFITNIKTGIESAKYRNWGEVTENQGLAVIASSNIILLLVFVGVLVLQAGLWYTDWEYQQRLKEFYAAEETEKTSKTQKGEKADSAQSKKKK
ncbi:LAFE_0H03730g1_1 [Lachancea fermentati]|uniref:LAFE_0H03730g1_1 n=1 Tax=Lachancea fermentati TaxID=4955 RepID=A0A1G4MJJ7_LACFM|nr:LAFE_0H03730g1_1 [Lachancea fermentati]